MCSCAQLGLKTTEARVRFGLSAASTAWVTAEELWIAKIEADTSLSSEERMRRVEEARAIGRLVRDLSARVDKFMRELEALKVTTVTASAGESTSPTPAITTPEAP